MTSPVLEQVEELTEPVTYRHGTFQDGYEVARVFYQAVAELSYRLGFADDNTIPTEEMMHKEWVEDRSLFQYLATYASEYWVAEKGGRIIGYARTIEENGLRELTEFFVLPGEQAQGVGRTLLQRAFPTDGAEHLTIIATPDLRAQMRYLKAGMYPRFPLYSFFRKPQDVPILSDIDFQPVKTSRETLELLAEFDLAVLGHRRDLNHAWLLDDRQCYLYYRGGRPIGYGYVGNQSGPFLLLDERWYPAVLAHAEKQTLDAGHEEFAVNVPMINSAAADYLVQQGFEMGRFYCFLMTNKPFGHFEKYINTSPIMFL